LRRHKIGFVFQRFNLLPTLTAKGNIAIAQFIHATALTLTASMSSRKCLASPGGFTISLPNFPAASSSA